MLNGSQTKSYSNRRSRSAPPGGFPETVTSTSLEDWGVVILSSSVNGDKKTPNPFSYSLLETVTCKGSVGNRNVVNKAYSYTEGNLNGAIVIPTTTNSIAEGSVYNNALNNLIGKIRQSDYNLGVSLGELKETVHLSKDILGLTRKFASKLPKGRLIAVGSKLLADAWLTYSYGVRPLINDIHAILEIQPRTNYKFYLKVRSTQSNDRSEKYLDNAGWNAVRRITEKCTVKFSVTVDIPNPLQDFGDRVGALNPALIAWELIPLSFVADWFVNVGQTLNILGACASMSNYQVLGSSTTFHSRNTFVKCLDVQNLYPLLWEASYSGRRKNISVVRSKITSLPLPMWPPFQIPTGSSQLLSAAALLRTIGLK